MKLGILALASAASMALPGGAQDEAQGGDSIVRAGRVLIGDGRTLEDVRIRMRSGKIVAVDSDRGPLPSGARVLDFRRHTVIPGLVAAYTELAAADQQLNLTPDVVAADQFDFYRELPQLVSTGLTTVYLTPGRVRLVPGQGSVVKLAGKDVTTRLLKEDSALRVTLAPAARRGVPVVFEPTPTPTADDPLVPARKQRGSTRASQLQVLEAAFVEAEDEDLERGGEGPTDTRYLLAPLRAAIAASMPVRLAAQTGADIVHGLDFVTKRGMRVILERPNEVVALAGRLARSNVACVVQVPLRPALPNPGDLLPGDERNRGLEPGAAAALARAGVPVALVPSSDADLDKLRILAGIACRYGMPEDKALGAITLEAARILGVSDRVGSIEAGKDADLVVLSGAPFDARTLVERVFADGIEVWKPAEPQTTFAVRAGRVLTGDGRELRDAAVVVRGKRIVYVGPFASVPPGAEVIYTPDAVLVPGFVAAATRLGLHADPGARLTAGADVDIASALRADDPAFRLALAAGITTLFVTPEDAGAVGGRVCAVKTHGNPDRFVVRPVTGLRMTLTAGGKAGKDQILGALKKAKDYIDPPKKEKKPEPKKEEEEPKQVDPITGSWKGTVSGGPLPQPMEFTVEMKLAGKNVDATLSISMFPQDIEFKGTFENNVLDLRATLPIGEVTCKGTLQDGRIRGTITSTQGSLNFDMGRTSSAPAPAATKSEGKKNEALEPYRPILKGEAPLVVKIANADAAKAAIEAVAVEGKLKLVLAGNARDVTKKRVAPPKGQSVGFILGVNEVAYQEKGKQHNVAQDLADLGYRVILVSRAQVGTRYLPVHAAWAVTTGLDPRHALGAISGAPAECFGLNDRIGRLAEGGDADMVLLSGDPFDLTTRILGVWVDGALEVDNLQRDNETEEKR